MSTLYASPTLIPSVNPALITPIYVNTQKAQSGPGSRIDGPTKKKNTTIAAKRKRTGSPEPTASDHTQARKNMKDVPRKKKANRACFHCQKAHLTCDDSRPCQRCVRRGIADCTEGHRKKAKYLLDEEEIQRLKSADAIAEPKDVPASEPIAQELESAELISMPSPQNVDSMFGISFDSSYGFGSEAANLEYSILSAILGNPSPPESGHTNSPPPSQLAYSWTPQESYGKEGSPPYSSTSPFETSQQMTSMNDGSSIESYPYAVSSSTSQSSPDAQSQQYPVFRHPSSAQQTLHPLAPRYPFLQNQTPPGSVFLNPLPTNKDNAYYGATSPPPSNSTLSPSSAPSIPPLRIGDLCNIPGPTSQLQGINDRITAPYDYTEGYHFLMKHLQTRFEKNDILRIVRALAIFRPSLIALQMPLSLDDEVFLEKCFQRSLLESEKLISFSGTPTVIWRRTGEICLASPEFCTLTGWSMDHLVGRKKYIYELFENQSVVEYWESFASHAFENTTQSVYTHCVLLKPNGAPIPATFSFTIRRDLFDLPSVIVGQWLPLL